MDAAKLTIFVISTFGYRIDSSNSQDGSLNQIFAGLSSSQVQQILQSIASSKDLAAFFSNVLSSTVDNSTVIEVTTDSSTVTSEETTDSTTASTSSDSFVQDLLSVHNEYRTLHGVANLTLNSTLSAYALEWAEYLAEKSLLQHRTDAVYGENIYWSSAATTARAAADAWYSEISDYTDYTTEPDMTSFSSGHFTQMVWKSSEQLGCGSVTASSGALYVVCNYSPPGNYIGEFVANVLHPSSSKSRHGFEEATLAQHNYYRKKHRVPNLKIDPKITRVAQDWANHLAQSDTMQHRPNNNYGENIYATTADNVNGKDAVDSWYSECSQYMDYKHDPSTSGHLRNVGHFTQVVWKGSERLGVAKATSRSGMTYVVANYSPAGNYRGEYVANVLPPRA